MGAPVLRFKRGQFANLPGLQAGEPGFTTDRFDLFIGINSTTNGNKFFGSHRYWNKETETTGSGVRLVEGSNNGDNFVELKAPDSIASSVTYTLPGTITNNGYLKVASGGALSWDNEVSAENINVIGIGSVSQLLAGTAKVGAGLTVEGATDLNGGLDVTGQSTLNGDLNVTGVTTSANLTVTSTASIQNLSVGGLLLADLTGNVTGNVTSTGSNSFGQVSVSGVTTSTGGFVGDLTGNADTATALETSRDFSASGDASASAVSFDGTGNVDLALTLATVNSNTGSFGSQTQIPVVTVNEKGLVTAVTTASVGTALTVTGDSGTEQIDLLSESLAISGGSNVTTTAAANGVSVALNPQINLTAVNASGIVTASSFSGSGSGLTAGTTPVSTLDIDGATDIGADLTDSDLLIVDDGASGTNRKTALSRVKSYVLGGGAGANFNAISVSGIATLTQTTTQDIVVSAGATVTGALEVSGGADISGGETTLSSATVSDLTAGRVVIAGPSGSIDDDAGLTYEADANALTVDGQLKVTGVATATSFATGAEGSSIIINSSTITGPSSITIDPATLNDNGGIVYILGDLQVKGTTTTIESTTVNIVDANIQLATGAANDAAANGAGITVDSGEGDKTFQFEALGDNFGSSENLNLASGKVYKIANSEVLSATDLSVNVAVDLASLNIDGGNALSGSIADADLFIVDDGGVGSNKSATAQQVKDYVLGGGQGANFSAINVTGISTVTFADATTLKVGAGATFTGAIDANGGLDVTGSATIDQLSVSGVITATDLRNSSGGLLPLVGVSSVSGHTGLVTAFKFRGAGLEDYIIHNGVADIVLTGVAATTFTTSETFTATSGQTSFTFAAGYSQGFLDIYQNGVRLIAGTDYTAQDTAGGTFTLAVGANLNDQIEAVAWKSLGDVVNINTVNVIDNLTVAGVATVSGSINGAINHAGVSTVGHLQVTTVNASGIVTATSGFVGDLTGNVTGNVTGDLTGNVTGNVTGDLTGNADTATALETARDFSASGDASASAVSFDGTGNVDLALTLATVNSNTGTFGSTTQIPVVTVNAKGLVTAVTTANVGTALTVTGDSGTEQIDLLTEALAITGGSNVTTSAASNGVEVALNSDISLTSVNASTVNVSAGATVGGALNVSGEATLASATVSDLTSGRVVLAGASGALVDSANLTFGANGLTVTGGSLVSAASTFSNDLAVGGDVVITGNLTVNGTTTQVNTNNTTIEDTLLELQRVDGGNLTSDTNKDVGLVLNYFDGSAKKAAIFWDDSAGRFALASEATETTGVLGSITYGSLEVGGLFLNDCAGASQVISCANGTRSLENIMIDGGTF